MEFFFGEHHLDIDRRELRRDARLIAVEPQVFDLLVYLVQNRDRVVSKDDLIATVWRGRIVSESTITSHIHSARKAVGDSGEAQRLIRTLPRKGFRLIGAVHEEPLAAPSRHSPFDLSGKAPSAVRSEATGPTSSAAMPVTPATPPGLVTEDPPGALLALPDKPSIAVLPFANLSRDLGQEYFAYGIAEDIITALSRYPSLFVIARYSSFAYKGRAVDAKQVGRKLGARYILEGSLRKSGNRIRVTAQVVETETGKHVWAERYDRELANIFAVQDNITEAVTTAIAPAIAAAERQRAMRMLPGSFNAWAAYQHGLWHVFKISREHDALAQKYFQQAIDIDPAFAGGYKGLAWVHISGSGRAWDVHFTRGLRLG